jgi:hypothetical protein
VNLNRNVKGRVKLRLRETVGPKIADIIKERIEDILQDPDEQFFFDNKMGGGQLDSDEELQYQKALMNSEKRTGNKLGSKMGEFMK